MNEQATDVQEWLRPLYQRFRPSCSPDARNGTVRAYELGQLQVFHLQARGQRLGLEQKTPDDAWLVAIAQRDGSAFLHQARQTTLLAPGQVALLTSTLPFQASFEEAARQTWLVLPVAAMRGAFPEMDESGVTRLQCSPVQAQMLETLADLGEALATSGDGEAGHQHVANAVAELLAAALATSVAAETRSPASLANFHVRRIKEFILRHLHDPDLTVRKVSDTLKISPAHLHRVFMTERQTFSEWLWDQRLLACKAALENPANARMTVSQIAFGLGFSNSSHFSRAFRAKFGLSPTDVRMRRTGGEPAP